MVNIHLFERVTRFNLQSKNRSDELSVIWRFNRPFVIGLWFLPIESNAKIYGAYPKGYLSRVERLFPDAKRTLHLFSGSLPKSDRYLRMDVNPKWEPEICGDAHKLSSLVEAPFDLIVADPPYSERDAKKYGTKMINRRVVIHECAKVLEPGGWLVWLDTLLPQFTNAEFSWSGSIMVIRSVSHSVRAVTLLQRVP